MPQVVFLLSFLFCQRFTNEDHLAVHKHKHEMTLKFGPARTDSVIIAGKTLQSTKTCSIFFTTQWMP